MIEHIIDKIDTLPPLPKTITLIQTFINKQDKTLSELIDIVNEDPLIGASLLKISNSAMFGFRNKVETTNKAVELLGINFTCSIVLGIVVRDSFDISLDSYNITTDKFIEISNLSINILYLWFKGDKIIQALIMPLFLEHIGMFILSDTAHKFNKTEEFSNRIAEDWTNIAKIEKDIFGITSSQVSAKLFKKWNLSDTLVDIVSNIDNENPMKYKKEVNILRTLEILINPIEQLSKQSISKAIDYAQKHNLDTKKLQNAIDTIQIRLVDAL